MVRKSWEKKVDNKGFTLVELIVVLVILAILAAILVPALLGYIDRAKGSQILLNGKSVLTAAQAEASNAYGTAGNDTIIEKMDQSACKRVGTTADTPNESGALFGTGENAAKASSDKHGAWTIKYVIYYEGSNAVYYNGSSWVEGLTWDGSSLKDSDGAAVTTQLTDNYGSYTKNASGTVEGKAWKGTKETTTP